MQLVLDVALADHATFDDLVPGNNAIAVEAVRRQTENRDPLIYLFGPDGVGKSHLLQAACRIADDAAYLPLADFVAFPPEVLQGWSRHRLLAVDDIERIAGNPDWEQALFALFNAVTDADGLLLMAAQARPAELGLKLPDLVSRLSWGASYALAPLDDGSLELALTLRARQRGMTLPADAVRFMITRHARDWATLVGLLDQLDRASLEARKSLSLSFVRKVLGNS
ncbi:MAG: DnaA regulatory inactivator Hda [Gammaproteobacteria bacterium]|nr:DnaA regulatory inactivator Hda [Gammaproteobacteria bacterium]MCP5137514.1 DnaA regulatory inactivator Hda [Gammaproteobacteria bacterium]